MDGNVHILHIKCLYKVERETSKFISRSSEYYDFENKFRELSKKYNGTEIIHYGFGTINYDYMFNDMSQLEAFRTAVLELAKHSKELGYIGWSISTLQSINNL
jgi:hypothetical protein